MSGKGGAFRPAPLSCRYCRVPHDLIIEAHADGLPNTWAVLLMLTSYIRDEGEAVLVCCSRGVIADALGITERQVTHAVEALKRKGIIETARKGGNGRAAVYRLVGVGSDSGPAPTRVGSDSGTGATGAGSDSRAEPTREGGIPDRGGNSWFGFQSETNCRVGSDSGTEPNRTSKEVLIGGTSLGGLGVDAGVDGGEPFWGSTTDGAGYPPPRALLPVEEGGCR